MTGLEKSVITASNFNRLMTSSAPCLLEHFNLVTRPVEKALDVFAMLMESSTTRTRGFGFPISDRTGLC